MNSCCRVALHVTEPDGALLHVGSDDAAALSIGGEIYSVETPPYEGAYEADALFREQLFPTANKRMLQDFAVHAINYTEAPNEYGTTVTIGG